MIVAEGDDHAVGHCGAAVAIDETAVPSFGVDICFGFFLIGEEFVDEASVPFTRIWFSTLSCPAMRSWCSALCTAGGVRLLWAVGSAAKAAEHPATAKSVAISVEWRLILNVISLQFDFVLWS
jgi:hypothetical protein